MVSYGFRVSAEQKIKKAGIDLVGVSTTIVPVMLSVSK